MLFGGRDGKREATAIRSLGLCAHSSSVCSHNTTLHAEEVAGHFPFVSVPGFYKLMHPFLTRQRMARDEISMPYWEGF